MDRDEAIKLLQGGPEGIAEWNQPRQAGDIIPDLSKWKDHDSFEAAFARLLKDLKAEESAGTDALSPRSSRRKKPR